MTNHAELISRAPYAVQVLQGEADITQAVGVRSIQYHPDGRVTQLRLDGAQQAGRWELIEQDTVIRMTMEQDGVSDWLILALDAGLFRKRHLTLGIIAIQTPIAPAVAETALATGAAQR